MDRVTLSLFEPTQAHKAITHAWTHAKAWLMAGHRLTLEIRPEKPSEAHHVKQGQQYTCIALCPDCHRGPILGWHGQRRMWAIKKMAEIDALAVTVKRLMQQK